MVVPLFIGREKSISALKYALSQEKEIFLATQKNAKMDDPSLRDIYSFGTLAAVLQLLKMPDGTVKALVEAKTRVKIKKVMQIGLRRKIIQLPRDWVRDWRRDFSIIGPRINPITRGPPGNSYFRIK